MNMINETAAQLSTDIKWRTDTRLGCEPDLNPTTYCTAMWNGNRCDGTHDQHWGYDGIVHSVSGEEGQCYMWRDGWGGIRLNECLLFIEEPDFDLGWSDLDGIHADAREKRIHADAHSIDYAGQLAGIGISGLLDTDSRAWLGTYLA